MSVERRKFREAMDPTLAWRRKAKAAKHSALKRKKSKEAISALKQVLEQEDVKKGCSEQAVAWYGDIAEKERYLNKAKAEFAERIRQVKMREDAILEKEM